MTTTRATPTPAPVVSSGRRGGTRRALRRAWRECLVPIAAKDTAAVGPLRGIARSALTWWDVPVQTRSDIILTLSELVTNALLHTDGPLRVRLTCREGTVRLDVADSSPAPARAQAPDLDADIPHGWGLTIAEALANRLSVTKDDIGAGKIVTAEFDLAR